jgi:hypothetical protein
VLEILAATLGREKPTLCKVAGQNSTFHLRQYVVGRRKCIRTYYVNQKHHLIQRATKYWPLRNNIYSTNSTCSFIRHTPYHSDFLEFYFWQIWSARIRPDCCTYTGNTNVHALGGIRTHNHNVRAIDKHADVVSLYLLYTQNVTRAAASSHPLMTVWYTRNTSVGHHQKKNCRHLLVTQFTTNLNISLCSVTTHTGQQ